MCFLNKSYLCFFSFCMLLALLPVFADAMDRSGAPKPGVRMEKTIPGPDGLQMEATLIIPVGAGPFPAVLILPGGNGAKLTGVVYPHHVDFGWKLVEQGFVAMVLNYRDTSRFFMDERWVTDIEAALDTLESQKSVDTSRIFLVGFSMGGTNALRVAARRHEVSGLVCYFSPVLFPPKPGIRRSHSFSQPLDLVDSLRCPLLILQGDADPITEPHQSELFEVRTRERGIPVTRILFPGGKHGFTYRGVSGGRVEFNQALTDSAFHEVLRFIHNKDKQ
ncbi:MAG: hypothetical protein AUK31_01190 [Fibrobacteres bacterium CG2_30_45_31]|nr:MAG: hypothetical protein AUK31_01190 [Fibrobacteres bacterium CG2_30_45_31]